MWLFAIIALAFNSWMIWTLYSSLKEETVDGWRDYASTVWIFCGSSSSAALAIAALVKVVS